MKINEMILYKNTEFYDNLVTMEKLYEGGTGSAEEEILQRNVSETYLHCLRRWDLKAISGTIILHI